MANDHWLPDADPDKDIYDRQDEMYDDRPQKVAAKVDPRLFPPCKCCDIPTPEEGHVCRRCRKRNNHE